MDPYDHGIMGTKGIGDLNGQPITTSPEFSSKEFLRGRNQTAPVGIFIIRMEYQYSRTRRWRKFQKGKMYNAEEHVAIESFVTTLIH